MTDVFFDLDGTLTDSSPGIVRCVNHGLTSLGFEAAPEARVRAMIGTPLTRMYEALMRGAGDELVDRAVAAYRERFNDVGIFENSLFPGVLEALTALRESGRRLVIVTSKPAVAARRVLVHFQIASFFAAVHGPELDERTSSKTALLGDALRGAAGDRVRMAMVGDRREDMAGARAHGIRGVGAGWGYGSVDELHDAAFLAATWPEAATYLLSQLP